MSTSINVRLPKTPGTQKIKQDALTARPLPRTTQLAVFPGTGAGTQGTTVTFAVINVPKSVSGLTLVRFQLNYTVNTAPGSVGAPPITLTYTRNGVSAGPTRFAPCGLISRYSLEVVDLIDTTEDAAIVYTALISNFAAGIASSAFQLQGVSLTTL